VAFVFWGVTGFLADEEISRPMKYLYDWAAPGSCLVFNCQAAGADPNSSGWKEVSKIYEQMGTPLYLRDLKRYKELLQPWEPDSGGFVSLLDWHGFEQSELAKEGSDSFGPLGGGFGVYCVK
jgi:hypothetical protein